MTDNFNNLRFDFMISTLKIHDKHVHHLPERDLLLYIIYLNRIINNNTHYKSRKRMMSAKC